MLLVMLTIIADLHSNIFKLILNFSFFYYPDFVDLHSNIFKLIL